MLAQAQLVDPLSSYPSQCDQSDMTSSSMSSSALDPGLSLDKELERLAVASASSTTTPPASPQANTRPKRHRVSPTAIQSDTEQDTEDVSRSCRSRQRHELLARARCEVPFRCVWDQAVITSAVAAVCQLKRAQRLDMDRTRSTLGSLAACSLGGCEPSAQSLLEIVSTLLDVDWEREVKPQWLTGRQNMAQEAAAAAQIGRLELEMSQSRPSGDCAFSCAVILKGITVNTCNHRYAEHFLTAEEAAEQPIEPAPYPLFFWCRALSPEGMKSFTERWAEVSFGVAYTPTPGTGTGVSHLYAHTHAASTDTSQASFSLLTTCVSQDGSETLARVSYNSTTIQDGLVSSISITPIFPGWPTQASPSE